MENCFCLLGLCDTGNMAGGLFSTTKLLSDTVNLKPFHVKWGECHIRMVFLLYAFPVLCVLCSLSLLPLSVWVIRHAWSSNEASFEICCLPTWEKLLICGSAGCYLSSLGHVLAFDLNRLLLTLVNIPSFLFQLRSRVALLFTFIGFGWGGKATCLIPYSWWRSLFSQTKRAKLEIKHVLQYSQQWFAILFLLVSLLHSMSSERITLSPGWKFRMLAPSQSVSPDHPQLEENHPSKWSSISLPNTASPVGQVMQGLWGAANEPVPRLIAGTGV